MNEDENNLPEENEDFIIEECVLMVRETKKGKLVTYTGKISTMTDGSGNNIYCGRFEIADGFIWTSSNDRSEFDNYTDTLAGMMIDRELDLLLGETSFIAGREYNLN